MAQHDYSIANDSGANVRADLNNALSAIVSLNSGATEPATTFAFQLWADTTANVLKLRNSANNAWITLRQLDGDFTTVSVDNGSAAAPSVFFNASGTDTGFYSSGTDAVDVSTAGTRRLGVGSAGDVTVFGGNVTLNAQGDLRFADSDSSNWVAFQAPATVASNVTWTLPNADGSPDQALVTNGSGTLSWADAGGASDAITEGNTSAEVVDTGSDGHFKVITEGTEALRVDSSQRVGIGTASPGRTFHALDSTASQARFSGWYSGGAGANSGSIEIGSNTSFLGRIEYDPNGNTNLSFENTYNSTGAAISWITAGSERARIDGSGRLLVGTTSTSDSNALLQVSKDNAGGIGGSIVIRNGAANTAGNSAELVFKTSSGYIAGTNSAKIAALQTTSSEANDLAFYTYPATTGTERMRIISDGTVFVAKTAYGLSTAGHELQSSGVAYHTSSTARVIIANKLGADGILVGFYHDTTEEGNISVSGSTVSYNGAHLSRWSQLPGNAERTEILRGSVLSNIDEMCEWAYDAEQEVLWAESDELPEGVSVGDVKTPAKAAGTEDNEQLNRMKVSDVEGDPNVAGVFQAWDDDDDTYTNDFYCAMTGDFVIRIAQGVTVKRGDLLMSAGDGTAKPQDDDIIRSKTVAKVTSTHVSETYDDGSYCVPCVLMAC